MLPKQTIFRNRLTAGLSKSINKFHYSPLESRVLSAGVPMERVHS